MAIEKPEDIAPETVVHRVGVYLIDAQQRQIGQVTIERNKGNPILGKFVPGSDFSAMEHLLQDFEEAVNLQALSIVDELDTEIPALGLHLCFPDRSPRIEIHDVQIWSDGSITFRFNEAKSWLHAEKVI